MKVLSTKVFIPFTLIFPFTQYQTNYNLSDGKKLSGEKPTTVVIIHFTFWRLE